MSVFAEVEQFIRDHRNCGGYTFDSTSPTPEGYELTISCRCGTNFERWATPSEAEDDLLWYRLLGFEN